MNTFIVIPIESMELVTRYWYCSFRLKKWGDGPELWGPPVAPRNLKQNSGVFEATQYPATQFRFFFDRSDLPIVLHQNVKLEFEWKVAVEIIDAGLWLPIFLDGLREKKEPYLFAAGHGSHSLITQGNKYQILSCVPQCVFPLKAALDTHDFATIMTCLKIIQALACCSGEVGMRLVDFYPQLLPVLNRFKWHKRNLGDQMDFGQHTMDGRLIGETIEETLCVLHATGGSKAFAAMKAYVPTFEVV